MIYMAYVCKPEKNCPKMIDEIEALGLAENYHSMGAKSFIPQQNVILCLHQWYSTVER